MKLEDMPVVTAEQVMRFRSEAIRQRDSLAAQVEGMRSALQGLADLYDTDEGCRSTPEYVAARNALALTPPASLALHDAELLERMAEKAKSESKGRNDPENQYWVCWLEDEADSIRAEAGGDGE